MPRADCMRELGLRSRERSLVGSAESLPVVGMTKHIELEA